MKKMHFQDVEDVIMQITDTKFMKDFIRITHDAWLKGWHERNGGNMSYRLKKNEIKLIKDLIDENRDFHPIEVKVANLAHEYFVITGTGKFFRNVILDAEENLGIIQIDEKGEKYKIVWGLRDGGRPTSELPTHLMNHAVKKEVTKDVYRVIMHSHTTNIIALTFVLPLKDEVFTRELWEMATECPVVFPRGVGVIDWMVPGGAPIAEATSVLMKKYDVAIWAHHGTFCSAETLDQAFGLMDTVEKSAEILVKVLSMGGKQQSITTANFKELAQDFKIDLPDRFLK